MSEATTLRYERMTNNKSLTEALSRQKDRVKGDEQLTRDIKEVKFCDLDPREQEIRKAWMREETNHLRSIWEEKLELKLGFKHAKEQHFRKIGEARLANKACLAVRREALKRLLENEYSAFEKELQATGKTFHLQRF